MHAYLYNKLIVSKLVDFPVNDFLEKVFLKTFGT